VAAVANTAVAVAAAGANVTPAQTAAASAAVAAAIASGASAAQVAAVATTAVTARPVLNTTAIVNGMPSFSLDLTQLTQYGSKSGVSYVSQDGYSSGQFSSLSVDKNGLLQGTYTNGKTLTLGQVLLTNFLNPNGLLPLGDNQWAETSRAGKQNSDAPGNGVLGTLQSGAVEESNVDLTSQLVNMIIAQRMYQANAQSIKAQDTVMQTLVNL
jgi:flagellar hook protein FlgE